MNRIDIIKAAMMWQQNILDVWDKYDYILTEQVMEEFAEPADDAFLEALAFTEEQKNMYLYADYTSFEDEDEVTRFAAELYLMYPDVMAKYREKYGDAVVSGPVDDVVLERIMALAEPLA